jgi:Fe-S-cluster containining protein
MFPCQKCGQCCRMLALVLSLQKFDRGDGVCRHLVNNLCDIYEYRPLICNIDDIYNKYYSSKMSLDSFYMLNISVCNLIKHNN